MLCLNIWISMSRFPNGLNVIPVLEAKHQDSSLQGSWFWGLMVNRFIPKLPRILRIQVRVMDWLVTSFSCFLAPRNFQCNTRTSQSIKIWYVTLNCFVIDWRLAENNQMITKHYLCGIYADRDIKVSCSSFNTMFKSCL